MEGLPIVLVAFIPSRIVSASWPFGRFHRHAEKDSIRSDQELELVYEVFCHLSWSPIRLSQLFYSQSFVFYSHFAIRISVDHYHEIIEIAARMTGMTKTSRIPTGTDFPSCSSFSPSCSWSPRKTRALSLANGS